MASSKQQFGYAVEQQATAYLGQHGLSLIEHNYRCRYGEIDLIMRDKEHWVFVEVRYRNSAKHGDGAETITRSKQSRLIRTAKYYLQQSHLLEKVPCRFDVITLTGQSDSEFLWIKDAFQVRY